MDRYLIDTTYSIQKYEERERMSISAFILGPKVLLNKLVTTL